VSRFIFATDQSLGIKTEYTSKAVARLVNIFNCLAHEWMVKINERLHDMIYDGVSVSPNKKERNKIKNI
jgi:hypothetical protein